MGEGIKTKVMTGLIVVAMTVFALSLFAEHANAAESNVVNEATGTEYSNIYDAFQDISEGDTATLIINGTVQAGRYSGIATIVPNGCDITILAGEDTPTITGSIQLPINSTSTLTVGKGESGKTLKINGILSAYGGKLTTNSELFIENNGMALVVGYTSNGYPVEVSINGGTFKSTGTNAAVATRFDGAYIKNITGAKIINSSETSTYEGALSVLSGARVGEIKDSYFEAKFRCGIDVSWGGKIDKITGCEIVQNGYGTYKQGVGIACRMGTPGTDTRIGTIEDTTITANVSGPSTSEPYGSYASGIQVGYGSGGKCVIDTIYNCRIKATSTSSVYGGIQVLGSVAADVAEIKTIKDCTIENTGGGSGIFVQNAKVGELLDNTVRVNTENYIGSGNGIWVRGKSVIESIEGGTYIADGTSGNGRGLMLTEWQSTGLNPTVNSIKNSVFEGFNSGIYLSAFTENCTIGSITGAVTGDEYKTRIIGRNGPGLYNIAGTVGEISSVEIKSNGTTTSACGVNNTSLAYGNETLRGQIGSISNSAIEGFTGVKNEGGEISSISGSALTANGKTTYGDAVYNRDYKNNTSGIVTPGSIEEINDCVLKGYYGIFNYRQNAADENSTIALIQGCDIQAEYIGIYNREGTITSMEDTDITADASNESPQRVAILNYTAGSTIDSIKGGVINAPSGSAAYGIMNIGTIGDIEDTVITARSRGITIQTNSSIRTLKNVTATGETEMAFNIASGSAVEKIDGGSYIGGTHAVNLKSGSLGTITGDAVFYGRNGYAINNTEEADGKQISIEPTLSKEVKGYARYYGSEGVTNNNHIAETDKDVYPVFTPTGVKYKMSTFTEAVDGIDGVGFHYLTVDIKVKYDGNGGTGDMSDQAYEGEYRSDLTAEDNAFTRKGFTFIGWNTMADGTGTSYQSGDTINITEVETTLYAQWDENKYDLTIKKKTVDDAAGQFSFKIKAWGIGSEYYYDGSNSPSIAQNSGEWVLQYRKDGDEVADIPITYLKNLLGTDCITVFNGEYKIVGTVDDYDSMRRYFIEGDRMEGTAVIDGVEFSYRVLNKNDYNTDINNELYHIKLYTWDKSNWKKLGLEDGKIYENKGVTRYFDMSAYGDKDSEKGTYILQIPAGGEKTIKSIPHGYQYEISEEGQDGWSLIAVDDDRAKTKADGTMDADKEHTFLNSLKECTIKFNSDGGSQVDSQRVKYGEKATKPNDPTRDGYKFAGWYLGDDKFDFDTPVQEDITLKARWDEDPEPPLPPVTTEYTITYKLNGGEYNGSTDDIIETYEAGTKIRIHEAPVRDGYTFLYWKGSEFYPGDEHTVREDHIFIAQWKKNTAADDPDDKDNTNNEIKSVKTGDETSLISLLGLLFALAGTLAVLGYRRRRS